MKLINRMGQSAVMLLCAIVSASLAVLAGLKLSGLIDLLPKSPMPSAQVWGLAGYMYLVLDFNIFLVASTSVIGIVGFFCFIVIAIKRLKVA